MQLWLNILASIVLAKEFLIQVRSGSSFVEESQFFVNELSNIKDTFTIGDLNGYLMEYPDFPDHF